jgi:putative pyruvate formate lyase activating enzyme
MLDDTRAILQFLAEEVAPETYVNVMEQYAPAGRVTKQKYGEINRRVTRSEYSTAVHIAGEFGLRLDERRY